MARPEKSRKLRFIPENDYFCPDVFCTEGQKEIEITRDELETIRLSDLNGLEQNEASELMEISRGTYQRILKSARGKIADAMINGRAIRVCGGNYCLNDCIAKCEHCGHEWKAPCNVLFEEDEGRCPICHEYGIKCSNEYGECTLGERRHNVLEESSRTAK